MHQQLAIVPRTFFGRELATEVLGMRLANPLIIASGPLTDSTAQMLRAFDAGAGAVVTKTIFVGEERRHREKIRRIPTGLLNSTTYSRRPVEQWAISLTELAARDLPVIASLFADTPSTLGRLAATLAGTGCPAFELGIACPNDGSQQRLTPELVRQFAAAVRDACAVPFAVKLTATDNYIDQCFAAIEGGASAISISDTLPSVRVDTERRQLLLGGPVGYSGSGILPIVLHAVYQLRRRGATCPIIGIGGVTTASDVLEYIQLGAGAVQVYTALLRDAQPLQPMLEELSAWCVARGTALADLRGSALRVGQRP